MSSLMLIVLCSVPEAVVQHATLCITELNLFMFQVYRSGKHTLYAYAMHVRCCTFYQQHNSSPCSCCSQHRMSSMHACQPAGTVVSLLGRGFGRPCIEAIWSWAWAALAHSGRLSRTEGSARVQALMRMLHWWCDVTFNAYAIGFLSLCVCVCKPVLPSWFVVSVTPGKRLSVLACAFLLFCRRRAFIILCTDCQLMGGAVHLLQLSLLLHQHRCNPCCKHILGSSHCWPQLIPCRMCNAGM
jgi:hypothetical protein